MTEEAQKSMTNEQEWCYTSQGSPQTVEWRRSYTASSAPLYVLIFKLRVFISYIFNDMQRDCIHNSWQAGPFLLWYVCLFEKLREMCRSTVLSHNSLWTNCAAGRGLFEVRRHRTKLLTRQCHFRNELLARCMLLCLFLCGKSMRGWSPLWTTGAHQEWWRSKLNKKFNHPLGGTLLL